MKKLTKAERKKRRAQTQLKYYLKNQEKIRRYNRLRLQKKFGRKPWSGGRGRPPIELFYQREDPKIISARFRAKREKLGICLACKKPAEPGRKRCLEHLAAQRKR